MADDKEKLRLQLELQKRRQQLAPSEQPRNIAQEAFNLFSIGPDALVEGIFPGGADEIAGAANVLADKILGLFGVDTGQTVSEAFETGRQRQLAELERLPEGVRTGLNIAGGLVGPGAVAGNLLRGGRLATIGGGAAIGGAEGAAAGALSAEPGQRLEGAIEGGVLGAGLGGTIPALVSGLSFAVNSSPALKQLGKAGKDAARRIIRALEADQVSPEAAIRQLRRLGVEGLGADIGGQNVRNLAEVTAEISGPGAQTARRELTRRSAAAPNRVLEAINEVTGGGNADDVAEALMQQRASTAERQYRRALSVGQIDDPEINRLIQKSKPLRQEIKRAKDLDPDLADLPDNHIVLLDKAYKNIGGTANELSRKGNTVRANEFNDIRIRFKDRLVELNPAYGVALDSFSGQSRMLDAIETGRDALKNTGAVRAKDIAAMPQGERDMFKIGFAEAVRDEIEKAVDAGAARKLTRTAAIRNKVRAAFGDDTEGFNRFWSRIQKESRFAQTANLRFGSRTARLGEEMRRQGAMNAVETAADVATGTPVQTGLNILRRFNRPRQITPDVSEQLGRFLFTPGTSRAESPMMDLLRREMFDRMARQQVARQAQGQGGLALGSALGALAVERNNQ